MGLVPLKENIWFVSLSFIIGREKDVENSEILRLIQQSLQMDQERTEMSRALQHHQDTYHERHVNDDGFANLELNDDEDLNDHGKIIEHSFHPDHQQLAKAHEKDYEVTCPSHRSGSLDRH